MKIYFNIFQFSGFQNGSFLCAETTAFIFEQRSYSARIKLIHDITLSKESLDDNFIQKIRHKNFEIGDIQFCSDVFTKRKIHIHIEGEE
jgi:hypothetical protein